MEKTAFGCWSSIEKNTDQLILTLLPFQCPNTKYQISSGQFHTFSVLRIWWHMKTMFLNLSSCAFYYHVQCCLCLVCWHPVRDRVFDLLIYFTLLNLFYTSYPIRKVSIHHSRFNLHGVSGKYSLQYFLSSITGDKTTCRDLTWR